MRRAIASFPPVLKSNPYQRLLYEHLAAHGFQLADGAQFELGWPAIAARTAALIRGERT